MCSRSRAFATSSNAAKYVRPPHVSSNASTRRTAYRAALPSRTRRDSSCWYSTKCGYQITAGDGDLYCLRNTLTAPGPSAAYEIAIIPGPKIFVTRYPRIESPTLSFFAMQSVLRPAASERDGLGRPRHARGELLERRPEVRRVAGELLQRLLRVQPFVLHHFPLALVDLAEPIVALEVRCEQAEDDAIRHHHVGDVLQRSPLRFGDADGLLEGGVGEDDDDAGRVAAVAPLARIFGLCALRRRLHRGHLVERVEQGLGLVAAALRLE